MKVTLQPFVFMFKFIFFVYISSVGIFLNFEKQYIGEKLLGQSNINSVNLWLEYLLHM